jgi:hypothetical protein
MTRFYAAACIAGFGIVLAYAVWRAGGFISLFSVLAGGSL